MKDTFSERCYTLLRRVPRGKVTTYRELARALGTQGYRAVGQAMNRNPYAPKVPCHRVVTVDGGLGGYQGGVNKKIALLRREGVEIQRGKVKDFAKRLYKFHS